MNVSAFRMYTSSAIRKTKKGKETRIKVLVSRKTPEITFLYNETHIHKGVVSHIDEIKENIYSFMDHSTDDYFTLHIFIYHKKIERSEIRKKNVIQNHLDRYETIRFLKDFFKSFKKDIP